jgi:cytochrome c5
VRAVLKFACVAVVLGTAGLVSATTDAQLDKIADRIKPVGEVCVEGQPCAEAVATTASSGPRDGKTVFDTFCTACHTAGVLGAPKAFDKAAWKAKLANGFDATLANAIKGINAMPPRGTCGDCSDEEIGNAIKYMSK